MIEAFYEVCEFEFHPTNVGKFFKENNIQPIGITKDGNNLLTVHIGNWYFNIYTKRQFTNVHIKQN